LALTVVDDYSRESLAIEVGQRITGEQVVAVMNRFATTRGAPQRIRVDNGPEFVSRALDHWAYPHQVTSTSAGQASRLTMPWSSRSMGGCATSA
jgi:putative transposase